ncbi:DNA-binding response regulator [Luteibacter rhizovicinus DSM 16549]|uniref:DNA-binding response regulator n=1 Tax=Luteibacter rhizovicinus DSM 16549 TaxID=1440763 RepID=A0A0G9HAL6_9GAMM|nr:LytTR family DNA-binding domain-containing protein [Luteibacter rhizovicinus]APG03791.1 DNA-binding response regulator [Luteibacter rhizovicinus DSM 16549]KLD66633.1 LytTR family transcriptional regulator [Luteibacter rhizovicinus DSM 16549]KLD75150.1 LytTR family transcriptional regulator [Xanthomonas hyacinthi DSM 19077]
MRVLIADDEPLARARLDSLLARRADVEVVGSVADGEAALEACALLLPDVILLDIEMPGLGGTAVARRLAEVPMRPQVVFCTAYEQHALSAFDLGATDYLLKPVRAERLDEALDRAATRLQPPVAAHSAWLRARSGADEVRVRLDDVLYLLADEKYVAVHHGGGMWLIDDSLRQLETAHGERLVRLHRNCLVPRARLLGLRTLSDGRVLARLSGTEVTPEVSRRNLPAVRHLLRTDAG